VENTRNGVDLSVCLDCMVAQRISPVAGRWDEAEAITGPHDEIVAGLLHFVTETGKRGCAK
jgi:hypothetical protein